MCSWGVCLGWLDVAEDFSITFIAADIKKYIPHAIQLSHHTLKAGLFVRPPVHRIAGHIQLNTL